MRLGHSILRPGRLLLAAVLTLGPAAAQHCGGPCEVNRGPAPQPAAGKLTLSAGIESGNWRYVFNWWWIEDGVQKHSLEATLGAPPLRDFGYRRMFVSPAGNGFLVTGNAYARKQELKDREPPLFVFCDPAGKRLVEVPLLRALEPEERIVGQCPACADCCKDMLYVFAEDPALTENGCFVELQAFDTVRTLGFFLPLGLPVTNRGAFETVLEEAEWAAVPAPEVDQRKKAIGRLLEDLGSDDLGLRTSAADALVARGYLARSLVRAASKASKSGNYQARCTAIEARLRPWNGRWEAMAKDLGLLARLLAYADADVVRATRSRAAQILPVPGELDAAACAAWIREHRAALRWDAREGRYVR